jgi:hypothetical protein
MRNERGTSVNSSRKQQASRGRGHRRRLASCSVAIAEGGCDGYCRAEGRMGTSVEDATSETHETRRGPAGFSGARMRSAGDSVRRGGGNVMVYTILLISSIDIYNSLGFHSRHSSNHLFSLSFSRRCLSGDYMLRHLHLHLHLRCFNLVKTCRLYQPNFKSLLNLIL